MRIVVIGGVAAGLSAASQARRLNREAGIVVLEKGPKASYGACGLPYYIEGYVRTLDELVVRTPEQFRRDRSIEIRTGTAVTSIRHARREVQLSTGELLNYDRLIIATGARPAVSAIAGREAPNVFTLHTWEDGERLQRFLADRRPQTALVVGGGYIGLEMAEAFRARGLRTTLVHAGEHLLHRRCPWLTERLRRQLEGFGVSVQDRTQVDQLDPGAAEVILLAPGLTPNTELAAAAGIEIGKTGAIAASERMETNLTGVYAAGDCAETRHLVTGRPAWIPLGTTANAMGRVAGANAAGEPERFPGVVGTSIVRVGGLGVATTGLSEPQAVAEGYRPIAARITARDRSRYFRSRPVDVELIADRASGRLLGGAVLGEKDNALRINVIAAALSARLTAAQIGSLDLAYAPPFSRVHDPLLIAAWELRKQM